MVPVSSLRSGNYRHRLGNALITPDFDGKRASPLRCADCQSKGSMPVQPLPTTNPCPNEVPRPGYL